MRLFVKSAGRFKVRVACHHGGVGLLPLLSDGSVILVEQCRYAYGEIITEIPAGKLERMHFRNVDKPRENWGCTILKGAGSWLGNQGSAWFVLPHIARSVQCQPYNWYTAGYQKTA